LDRPEILAVLDRLVRGEIGVTLDLQVPLDNQDRKVLQARVVLEGILDLVATKDQSDHLDCKDLPDNLA